MRIVREWRDVEHKNVYFPYDNTLNDLRVSDDTSLATKIYDMRRSAEMHRQARRHIQNIIKPGISLLEICKQIEKKIDEVAGENNINSGRGFPVGISLNEVAAHDSAYSNSDRRVIEYGDVCKIDFGTHVNGWITDSAFTVAFDPQFDKLLEAAKDSMWNGIRLAGPDALIHEIETEIKEVIESYEVEIDNKLYQLKPIENLGGHNILPYRIHGGDLILNAPGHHNNGERMREGQVYAIETFPSTGNGYVHNTDTPVSHYCMNYRNPDIKKLLLQPMPKHAKKFLKYMDKRSTLPFCTRWLREDGIKFKDSVDYLVDKNILTSYPPLTDKKGSYTAQFEHTIYLHEFGKEVLSAGDDY